MRCDPTGDGTLPSALLEIIGGILPGITQSIKSALAVFSAYVTAKEQSSMGP